MRGQGTTHTRRVLLNPIIKIFLVKKVFAGSAGGFGRPVAAWAGAQSGEAPPAPARP